MKTNTKKTNIKRSLLTITLLLLLAMLLTPAAAFAGSDDSGYPADEGAAGRGDAIRYIDSEGLLDAGEAAALNKKLDEVSKTYNFDTVVVVVYSLDGWEAKKYAAEMYEYYDFGMDNRYSGIILLLAMEDRDYGLAATGSGEDIFGQAEQDYLSGQFLPYLRDDDYFGGFMAFADGVETVILEQASGAPADTDGGASGAVVSTEGGSGASSSGGEGLGMSLILSLIIALVIALVSTLVMRGQLKSVRPQNLARAYIRSGSMVLRGSYDRFLYSTVSRTARSDSSSGGGGSFSSSSGRSYSGSSGKF